MRYSNKYTNKDEVFKFKKYRILYTKRLFVRDKGC